MSWVARPETLAERLYLGCEARFTWQRGQFWVWVVEESAGCPEWLGGTWFSRMKRKQSTRGGKDRDGPVIVGMLLCGPYNPIHLVEHAATTN